MHIVLKYIRIFTQIARHIDFTLYLIYFGTAQPSCFANIFLSICYHRASLIYRSKTLSSLAELANGISCSYLHVQGQWLNYNDPHSERQLSARHSSAGSKRHRQRQQQRQRQRQQQRQRQLATATFCRDNISAATATVANCLVSPCRQLWL